jgi:hypothetical protein
MRHGKEMLRNAERSDLGANQLRKITEHVAIMVANRRLISKVVRSQNVTASTSNGCCCPYAFTEHGAMMANV